MDYLKIYDALIEHRRNTIPSGYVERHHVKMRSLGGSDDPSNIVALTAREHYIAHLLLHKILRLPQTAYALWMMQCKSSSHEDRPFIRSSRMYEWARKEFAKYISRNNRETAKGQRNSQYSTCWISNINLQENCKIRKDEFVPEGWVLGRNAWTLIKSCKGCGIAFKANSKSQVYCSKQCQPSKIGCIGHPHTDEAKEKIRIANLGDNNPKRKFKRVCGQTD